MGPAPLQSLTLRPRPISSAHTHRLPKSPSPHAIPVTPNLNFEPMDDDAIYRPVSPNLDTISTNPPAHNEPVHPQHHRYRGSLSHQPPYSPPAPNPVLQTHPFLHTSLMPPQGLKTEEFAHDEDYTPDASVKSEKLKGKARKEGNGTGGREGSTAIPGTENINITVHFPVARIKRIMQADDDVGKVAQVTPVVVCKSHPAHVYAPFL